MKVKTFVISVFVVITVLAGYHSVKNSKISLLDYSLASLESLAGCETSPNHNDNKGCALIFMVVSGGSCVTSEFWFPNHAVVGIID